MSSVARLLRGEDATTAAGAALAAALRNGDMTALSGPLGAGKSALARAAIAARLAEEGREEPIPSPTYTLMQIYETARGRLVHADLYRLAEPDEALELGLLDAAADAVLFVEWAERLGPFAPSRRLDIALDLAEGGAARRMRAEARGEGWSDALRALATVGDAA